MAITVPGMTYIYMYMHVCVCLCVAIATAVPASGKTMEDIVMEWEAGREGYGMAKTNRVVRHTSNSRLFLACDLLEASRLAIILSLFFSSMFGSTTQGSGSGCRPLLRICLWGNGGSSHDCPSSMPEHMRQRRALSEGGEVPLYSPPLLPSFMVPYGY